MTVFPVDSLGHPVFAVIPVDNRKRPLVAWKEYQTRLPTTEEKEKWIAQFKGAIAGWAMPTGQVSGIVALDFDGEEGMQTLLKLGLRPNVRTPGNGAHVWVEAPKHPVRTGALDSRWPNMELKGDGGYVIVIGEHIWSQHKDSETIIGNYNLIDGVPSVEGDLGAELAQFVFQSKEVDSNYAIARVVSEALDKVNDGRNNAGFWLACELRDLGQSKVSAWAILEDNFYPEIPRGNHAYTKQELKDSLNSAYTKAATATKTTAAMSALELFNDQSGIELWHTPANEPYITIGNETFPVGSLRTREYINRLYFRNTSKPLGNSAVEEVISTLKWIANLEGETYEINLRIGYLDGRIYLDNEDVVGLKFLHLSTMGPFSAATSGKSVDLLRPYLNIKDSDWPLMQGLILSHFMQDGPYPIGVFVGPQGSAKSMNQSLVLSVSDPRPTREAGRARLPRNDNDLVVAAKHNRVLSYDNVSTIPDWLSDALCIFSTGGNLLRRQLYTDDDIIAYAQKKPVLLNGIGDIVTKPDLLDRSIVFECPPLRMYKNESVLWREFSADLPYILGAFKAKAQQALDRLKNYDNIDDADIRMVDFVHWCQAAGIEGFREAFLDNRNRGAEIAINNSAVGRYMLEIAEKHRNEPTNPELLERFSGVNDNLRVGYYVGTMRKLYEEGEMMATGDYDWPRKFETFVNQVYRIEPMLIRLGIKLVKHRTNFVEFIFVGYGNES